jgi:hypothetical protein
MNTINICFIPLLAVRNRTGNGSYFVMPNRSVSADSGC